MGSGLSLRFGVTGTAKASSTNTAPTAEDGEVETDEDQAYTFAASDFNFMDSDMDDTLEAVKIVTLPGSGKGTLSVDGTALTNSDLPKTVTKAELDNDKLTYEPPEDANGDDFTTFTFKVNDGDDDSATANTMTIDVDSVPDITDVSVTSTPKSGTTPKKYGAGEKIQVTVTFDEAVNVTDDPLVQVEVGSNTRDADYASGTGTTALVFEYTVVAADTDSDGIAVNADVKLDSDSGSEDHIQDGDGNDADVTFAALAAQSDHKVDGSLTPPPVCPTGQPADAFWKACLTAGNLAGTGTGYLKGVIGTLNPATVSHGGNSYNVDGFSILSSGLALSFESDIGTTVTAGWRLSVGSTEFPLASASYGSGSGTFTWSSHSLSWSSGDQVSVSLRVVATNNAPTASDGEVTTDEDTAYTFAASDFNFMDSDMDDTLEAVKIVTLPGSGKGTLSFDGTALTNSDLPKTVTKAELDNDKLTYEPPTDANGDDYTTFTFKVNDGDDDSATANTMTIDVNSVPDAPTASDGEVTTDEDTVYTFQSSDFNFMDSDTNDELDHVKIESLPGSGELKVEGKAIAAGDLPEEIDVSEIDDDNFLTYEPAADANGNDYTTFTFKVNDGDDDSASAYTMTIDVDSVPDVTQVAVTSTPKSGTSPKKYGAGEKIQVTVTFDEAVTVTSDPLVQVEVGSNTRDADYASGSGTTELVFEYTVVSDDTDTDGIEVNADVKLDTDSGTEDLVQDSDGHDADVTFTALAAQSDHKVDGTLTPPSTNNAATGAPAITGDAIVGGTLTAGAGTMADTDGLPATTFPDGYTFQWVRQEDSSGTGAADISGATGQTYTLVADDEGKYIAVKVSFTDGESNCRDAERGNLRRGAGANRADIHPHRNRLHGE